MEALSPFLVFTLYLLFLLYSCVVFFLFSFYFFPFFPFVSSSLFLLSPLPKVFSIASCSFPFLYFFLPSSTCPPLDLAAHLLSLSFLSPAGPGLAVHPQRRENHEAAPSQPRESPNPRRRSREGSDVLHRVLLVQLNPCPVGGGGEGKGKDSVRFWTGQEFYFSCIYR